MPLQPETDIRQIALDAIKEMRRTGESHEMCALWISSRITKALASSSVPEQDELIEKLGRKLDRVHPTNRYPGLKMAIKLTYGDLAATVEALESLSSLQERNSKLEEALAKCREKFDHYEQLHRLKCTAEGDEKADRNRDMVVLIDFALSHREE